MKLPPDTALFRFYEELNRYLPASRRKQDIAVALPEPRQLRAVIISFGVPLSDIDLILVNGAPVDFEYMLKGGDRVSVYPVFELLNIKGVTRLREEPLRKLRFVADAGLADLAEQLKRSGLDAICLPRISDAQIRAISINQQRIILTQRPSLMRFPGVTHAILIQRTDVEDQVQEVMNLLDIEKTD